MRGGYADCPSDAAHVICIGKALRRGQIVSFWDQVLLSGKLQHACLRHVDTRNVRSCEAQAIQVKLHPGPSLHILGQVQDVDRDVVDKPPLCHGGLLRSVQLARPQHGPLAERSVQDWLEREGMRIRCSDLHGQPLLRLPPTPMAMRPQAPLVLHPDPAPISMLVRRGSIWVVGQRLACPAPLVRELEGPRSRRRQGRRGIAELGARAQELLQGQAGDLRAGQVGDVDLDHSLQRASYPERRGNWRTLQLVQLHEARAGAASCRRSNARTTCGHGGSNGGGDCGEDTHYDPRSAHDSLRQRCLDV
mmetsp:Transcript_3997/g.14889  ORF Transcript_3997/g.14889 Transcript_3997/m.14889 type:complete len:305 (+) Transcript_3997:633-1547(+)